VSPPGGSIEGRRVRLRPVAESDYPLIHRWMNHPEVWHYMDYEGPLSLLDVAEDAERSRREGHPFTIVAGDRPIGRIGLNQFRRRDRICSLYMYVGEPAFWGKGFAQDAVMTLLGYAFDRWDLHRVELWALADNDRALAVYRRCGFAEDATLPERSWKDGRWVDRVVMSVARDRFGPLYEEWRKNSEGV
jgi:RimJ/RimL family protein N-acetyltransferase